MQVPRLFAVLFTMATFCRPKWPRQLFAVFFGCWPNWRTKKVVRLFAVLFYHIFVSHWLWFEILKIKMLVHSTTTDPFQFGLTDTRNTSHGSDSDENALKEIQFFFPEFDKEVFFDQEVNRWIDAYNNSKFLSVTKPRIKRPKLELDTSAFVHRLPTTWPSLPPYSFLHPVVA